MAVIVVIRKSYKYATLQRLRKTSTQGITAACWAFCASSDKGEGTIDAKEEALSGHAQ